MIIQVSSPNGISTLWFISLQDTESSLWFCSCRNQGTQGFSVFLRFLWFKPSLGFCFGFPCLRLKKHQRGSCSHYTDYINHQWNFNYYMPPLNFYNYRHQFVQSPRSLHDHEQYIHNYWLTFSEATSTTKSVSLAPVLSPSQLNYLHPHQSTRGKPPLLHNSSKLGENEKIASDICGKHRCLHLLWIF